MAGRDFDVKIASIGKANGLKGYVQLYLLLASSEDLNIFNQSIFDKKNRPYEIKIISKKKDHYLVKISGIDSREKAEALKGIDLFVKRSSFPTTSSDQFYHVDLIGMSVVIENGSHIGTVIDVVNFGAEDLLEIKKEIGHSIYHPFNKDFVIDVSAEQQKITIKEYQ